MKALYAQFCLLVFTTVVFVSAPLLWAADEQLGQRVIELPIKLIPGSLYELPISVNLGHDWKGVESTRQLRLFTDPPSGEPIFLKIHVREHR
jgi:hypothetical protein